MKTFTQEQIERAIQDFRDDLEMHETHADFEISVLTEIGDLSDSPEIEKLKGRKYGLILAKVCLQDAFSLLRGE